MYLIKIIKIFLSSLPDCTHTCHEDWFFKQQLPPLNNLHKRGAFMKATRLVINYPVIANMLSFISVAS